MESRKFILTGGGSAGHVTANLALLPYIRDEGLEPIYIGSISGIEKRLMEEQGVPYYGVSTGKFRRYFDPKNFSDPFRVFMGMRQARKLIKKIKPVGLFSKGGFVAVPVVRAAASLKVPCVIHEGDMTLGLANKLCVPVAEKVCCNFPETMSLLPPAKAVLTGMPIRRELFQGSKRRGLELCGFDGQKPVLMVIGGSQGSVAVNEAVRGVLPELLPGYDVAHVAGEGKIDNLLLTKPGYKQFEYLTDELPDLFAAADVVISRAGANAIGELLALRKPNILIPLTLAQSRGDQILNAKSFEKAGYSIVVDEDDLTHRYLLEKIAELWRDRKKYEARMAESPVVDSQAKVMEVIREAIKGR
ncbi:MAG: undecaprenyldiphospho-muramoylpentapeptide beta-N-acetylglucosaminyltransferase [Lachnospiraceae bacterium]|nr:undecaprenyldiphospho-muramoylpentapeptide beta-N-acetylglucosaminyltransferase [Lachnospiraceae bacterium]